MAITAAGVGSGLDIASIVNQLVSAERAPVQSRISAARAKVNTQISALGALKGALSNLKSKLSALGPGKQLEAVAATSSSSETFTAVAGKGAAAGSYDVEVVALAKAHKLVSQAYSGGANTVLGNGTVEISVGGQAFTVTLSDGHNTLGSLRDAINASQDNTGVTATLINDQDGARLLLTAKKTGTDNQIVLNTALFTMSEQQAAANAQVRIEGYDVYSQSNTVTGAVDGVTLTLYRPSDGQTGTLTIARDSGAGKSAIEDFVKAYNAVVSVVVSQTRYDAEAKKASTFTGDAAVRGVMQTLRGIAGGAAESGELTTLAELGIKTKTDGTLEIDSSRLTDVLSAKANAVTALFSGDGGIATRLSAAIDQLVKPGGTLDAKSNSLNANLKDLSVQQEALDRRIDGLQERYQKQFAGLDSLLGQMNATSSYLSQQLSSLSKLR
ncbi:flagellar filament capping protein FliD [Fontimonas sp. SYSU GA230001]|uniref:flagellar filament capping protein FliD n=1 Tax=Fontimonas sp. SYSU GA230001 TaxID=3142450 RepID=UPI0032B60CAA